MAEDKSAGAVKILEKKLQQGKWNAGNALAQEQGAIEQTKNTQMALDQIFNATGHDNVEDLVAEPFWYHTPQITPVRHD